MPTPPPKQVNKLVLTGAIISFVGLIWTILSILYFSGSLSSNKTVIPQSSDTQVGSSSEASTPTKEASSFNIRDFYQKVAKGQARMAVMDEAGKKPSYCSSNNQTSYGEIEYCTWYGDGNDQYASVTVTFVQQVVDGTSKLGF
jgi:hypothetical protein